MSPSIKYIKERSTQPNESQYLLGVGGLVERDVLVVNHILLGIFIDCSCIERDVTQTYHAQSYVKHWVKMELQCMIMSLTRL